MFFLLLFLFQFPFSRPYGRRLLSMIGGRAPDILTRSRLLSSRFPRREEERPSAGLKPSHVFRIPVVPSRLPRWGRCVNNYTKLRRHRRLHLICFAGGQVERSGCRSWVTTRGAFIVSLPIHASSQLILVFFLFFLRRWAHPFKVDLFFLLYPGKIRRRHAVCNLFFFFFYPF